MRTSNIERPTSNIEVAKRRFVTSMLSAARSMFGVRCSMFNVRFSIFTLRCSSLLFSFLAAGCCPPSPPPKPIYTGPTDSMDTVVADINRASGKISSLWTQLNYTATFIDPEKKTSQTVAGDGVLMYARPISLLLNGDKDVAGQVFQIGSNNSEFWVRIRSSASTFNYWWGHYANLNKPGARPIPIRPDLVVQVLGIGLFRTNFLVQPVPVMRFDNAADAYIFDLNIIATDRWETREEIWYDRVSKLPMKVILFANDGRVALRADLTQPTPVESPGVPQDQWPKIARHYDLTFPGDGTHITFDLLNIPQIQHPGRHNLMLPSANSFQRPDPDDGDKLFPIDPPAGYAE
jgi:hypothetical protein